MGRANGLHIGARRRGGPYKACLIGWRHTTQVWVYAARKRQLRSLAITGSNLTGVDTASFGELRGVTLRDAQGRTVPFAVQNGACSSSGLPDVQLACRQVWTYPLQPRGERLTLSIRSVAATTTPVGPGPWHLFVAIP